MRGVTIRLRIGMRLQLAVTAVTHKQESTMAGRAGLAFPPCLALNWSEFQSEHS